MAFSHSYPGKMASVDSDWLCLLQSHPWLFCLWFQVFWNSVTFKKKQKFPLNLSVILLIQRHSLNGGIGCFGFVWSWDSSEFSCFYYYPNSFLLQPIVFLGPLKFGVHPQMKYFLKLKMRKKKANLFNFTEIINKFIIQFNHFIFLLL